MILVKSGAGGGGGSGPTTSTTQQSVQVINNSDYYVQVAVQGQNAQLSSYVNLAPNESKFINYEGTATGLNVIYFTDSSYSVSIYSMTLPIGPSVIVPNPPSQYTTPKTTTTSSTSSSSSGSTGTSSTSTGTSSGSSGSTGSTGSTGSSGFQLCYPSYITQYQNFPTDFLPANCNAGMLKAYGNFSVQFFYENGNPYNLGVSQVEVTVYQGSTIVDQGTLPVTGGGSVVQGWFIFYYDLPNTYVKIKVPVPQGYTLQGQQPVNGYVTYTLNYGYVGSESTEAYLQRITPQPTQPQGTPVQITMVNDLGCEVTVTWSGGSVTLQAGESQQVTVPSYPDGGTEFDVYLPGTTSGCGASYGPIVPNQTLYLSYLGCSVCPSTPPSTGGQGGTTGTTGTTTTTSTGTSGSSGQNTVVTTLVNPCTVKLTATYNGQTYTLNPGYNQLNGPPGTITVSYQGQVIGVYNTGGITTVSCPSTPTTTTTTTGTSGTTGTTTTTGTSGTGSTGGTAGTSGTTGTTTPSTTDYLLIGGAIVGLGVLLYLLSKRSRA